MQRSAIDAHQSDGLCKNPAITNPLQHCDVAALVVPIRVLRCQAVAVQTDGAAGYLNLAHAGLALIMAFAQR